MFYLVFRDQTGTRFGRVAIFFLFLFIVVFL